MIMKIELTTVGEDYGEVIINNVWKYRVAKSTWFIAKRLMEAVETLIEIYGTRL
jgi:hypothetical protein